jgi:hypothetical protein
MQEPGASGTEEEAIALSDLHEEINSIVEDMRSLEEDVRAGSIMPVPAAESIEGVRSRLTPVNEQIEGLRNARSGPADDQINNPQDNAQVREANPPLDSAVNGLREGVDRFRQNVRERQDTGGVIRRAEGNDREIRKPSPTGGDDNSVNINGSINVGAFGRVNINSSGTGDGKSSTIASTLQGIQQALNQISRTLREGQGAMQETRRVGSGH